MKSFATRITLVAVSGYFLVYSPALSAPRVYTDSPSASTNGPILHVRFVNVGQGDCTVVRFPNGKILMVDCGSTKGGNPTKIKQQVQGMLNPANMKIDALVVTHPDEDHYNLIEQSLDGVDVDKIFIVGSTDEYQEADFDVWLETFPAGTIKPLRANEWNKQVPKLLGDFSTNVYVLAADVEDVNVGSEKNTRSITLKITYGQFDVILTGDATFDTEDSIIDRYSATPSFLDVELLKLGHHGSRATSTSVTWLDNVKPEWVVVSAGYENSYGHPSRDVIQRVESRTIEIAPHPLRWSWIDQQIRKYRRFTTYRDAVFASGSSGTINVFSDGTTHPVFVTEK